MMPDKKGVLGIVVKDGKMLLGKESRDRPFKGQWRLLGGKIESGEDSLGALRRELMEEARISVANCRYLCNTPGTANKIDISVYSAEWMSGELYPKVDEVSELGWFSSEEMRRLPVEELSKRLISRYTERLQ